MPTNKKFPTKLIGFIPDDFLSLTKDPLADVTPKVWEAAMPKFINPNLKIPIIFGTGGDIEKGDKYYKELWDNAKSHDFEKEFIPATVDWNDPVEPIIWNDKINKESLTNIVNDILSKTPVSSLDYMSINNPAFQKAIQDLTKENHKVIVLQKPRSCGFTQTLEQLKTLEQIESETWLRDFPQAKRGSNYTKSKNRKKKKR